MSLSYGFLSGEYSASQLAEIGIEAFGNGICNFGRKFEVSSKGSNGIAVDSGFALVGGYWAKNTASQILYVERGSTSGGRFDAVVVRADISTRTVEIAIVQGIPAPQPSRYIPVRDSSCYELVVAYIYVPPAATYITSANITDTREDQELCGLIMSTQEASDSIYKAYFYMLYGFSDDMSGLGVKTETTSDYITSKYGILSNRLSEKVYHIGDITITAVQPQPTVNWLLCNGGSIPSTYPTLRSLLNGVLPAMTVDARIKSWIYAGEPGT